MSVLFVNSSPRGAQSESLRLAEELLEARRRVDPGAAVDRLDLFADPLPAFATDAATAKMAIIGGGEPEGAAAGAWRSVERTAARVQAADTLLFTVPMWNSGVPWALKLFIDTITQPGIAFGFDPEEGYSGLLGGRSAIAIYTSHVYSPGVDERFGSDFHSTYFENWLRFVGIEAIESLRLQPTYPGAEDLDERRERALARARELGAALGAARLAA
jgi:FMN-dependent NADH-azoreductase